MKTPRPHVIKYHCNLSCYTQLYWLPSLDTRYTKQILQINECQVCGKVFYHWAGILPDRTQDRLNTIKVADLPVWFARLAGVQQQSRFGPIVSQYTMLIGQDTAHTYHRILARQPSPGLGGPTLSF